MSLSSKLRIARAVSLALTSCLFLACSNLSAQRISVAARVLTPEAQTTLEAVDIGPVPDSQPITLTLSLAIAPDRTAALDQFLAAQLDPTSSSYHKWLTPQQFAASYGATSDQIAAATAFLQSQGLTYSISSSSTRITVIGSAARVQQIFAIPLHQYLVNGTIHAASTQQPALQTQAATLFDRIDGLDQLPSAIPMKLATTTVTGQTANLSITDPLSDLASVIDSNTSPLITVNTSACISDVSQPEIEAYRQLFRQAEAQGITVLATAACASSTPSTDSFPASLSEVLSVTTSTAAASTPSVARPAWQVAPGLPLDSYRHTPDVTSADLQALAQTVSGVVRKTGSRTGNIAPRLYSLATTPGLFTQPDNPPDGTWEQATGLGEIDLTLLAKLLPRATGTVATTTTLRSSSTSVNYGQPFTLTSTVAPSVPGGTTLPTGTVTFSSTTQGIIGTAPLIGGTATLTLGTAIAVGSYDLTASYGGDALYSGSASVNSVVVTVTTVTATITGSISPSTSLPYGSTATATATVVLPSSSAAPGGTVSASIEGITGAVYTGMLSPNPGGNSATTNIVISAPPPGTYTVQITCAGNANFLCQAPVNLSLGTIKGNTAVTVSATPSAPQAGQPVTLTALIANFGNGTGTYNFTGNVTFYDNGKLIATAVVGSNQGSTSATLSGNVVHNIVATYSGDVNWTTSTSSPATITPTLLPTSVSLTSNVATALAGINMVFTATIYTTISNTVGPTGTVSFFDTYNGAIVQLGGSAGAVPATPNGPNQSIGRFSTTGLLPGVHSVYAVYNGDANFGTVTSGTLPVNLTDYNLTMIPQTLTLKAGQTGQAVMLLGLVGGFNGSVSFGCIPPSNSEETCSFNKTVLSGGGSTTMSVLTTAAKDKRTQMSSRGGPWLAAGSTFAMLFCFALPRRRRMLPLLVMALFALSFSSSLGCGQGGTPSTVDPTPTDPGTPLGTQIFTITTAGSDGVNTVRHNYQYQVTIQ